jgi:hypothetical protein
MRRRAFAPTGAATGPGVFRVIILARIDWQVGAELARGAVVLILGARCGGQFGLRTVLLRRIFDRGEIGEKMPQHWNNTR